MRTTLERWTIFVLVFLASGAGVGLYVGARAASTKNSAGGDAPLQLCFGLLYLLIFAWLLPHRKRATALLFQERWLSVLLIFALASTFWSVDVSETFRKSLGLVATTVAGLFIGMRYEPKQQLRILAASVGIGAVASLIVGLLLPGVGVMADGGWQGVYYLKNALARMMTLGVVCFAFLAISQRRYRYISVSMAALCGLLVVLAKSATGAVVCAAMIVLLMVRGVLHWPKRRLAAVSVLLLMVMLLAGVVAWNSQSAILSALGRDASLTGRLPLWHMVKLEILDRPALGSGYASFWTTPQADRFRDTLGWDAPNAHDGFLDMALGLGFVGLTIFAIGVISNLGRGVLAARLDRGIENEWPLFFLIFCLLYNLTESTLFTGNSVFWLLYSANAYWLVEGLPARQSLEKTEHATASLSELAEWRAAE